MTLHLKNDHGEQILFVYEVDKLTPEEIHIEVSTAIAKERECESERRGRQVVFTAAQSRD